MKSLIWICVNPRILKIADKYLAPPSIDETKANKDLHVVIGKPIELTCPAAGVYFDHNQGEGQHFNICAFG